MRTVPGPTDHVVVVGAGLSGLSAALQLAGRGRQVTVVERYGFLGFYLIVPPAEPATVVMVGAGGCEDAGAGAFGAAGAGAGVSSTMSGVSATGSTASTMAGGGGSLLARHIFHAM